MKEKTVFFSRKTKFEGPRKIGFDTDTIVRILVNKYNYMHILKEMAKFKGSLFIHEKVIAETKKVLVRDYDWDNEKAGREVKKLIKDYNFQIVPLNLDNPFFNAVDAYPGMHFPDNWIVADYKENGINKVYSGTGHVVEACKSVGIDAKQTLPMDARTNQRIHQFFKELNKFKKKRK